MYAGFKLIWYLSAYDKTIHITILDAIMLITTLPVFIAWLIIIGGVYMIGVSVACLQRKELFSIEVKIKKTDRRQQQ